MKALDSQLTDKSYQISNLEAKLNDIQTNALNQIKDIQFKTSRHDSSLIKMDSEQNAMMNSIRDLQSQFQDHSRSNMSRINDIEKRVHDCFFLLLANGQK